MGAAWYLELEGQESDLKAAAACFHTLATTVRNEDGLYVLESSYFAEPIDPSAICSVAMKQLTLINHLMPLRYPSFRPLRGRFVHRDETGTTRGYGFGSGASVAPAAQSHGEGVAIRADGSISHPPHTPRDDSLESALVAALASPEKAKALRLLAEGSWQSLYKALEIVRDAYGDERGLTSAGLCSLSELSLFRRTSQSPAVLGDAARHGLQLTDPPSNPMLYENAQALIRRLLRHWCGIRSPGSHNRME
jgi:hypothetical protein